ncbi:MAG TPA: hypothetical protein VM759_10020 [Longimicrobium sp.]|nr:hypothetical protein [Longimicrobium sp.]
MRRNVILTGLLVAIALAVGASQVEQMSASTAPSLNTVPTVTLTGPTDANPHQICIWTATASGGTGPYTFSWDWNSARGDVFGTVGYESEFNGHVADNYYFIVTVTDANSATDADTLQGVAGGPGC